MEKLVNYCIKMYTLVNPTSSNLMYTTLGHSMHEFVYEMTGCCSVFLRIAF